MISSILMKDCATYPSDGVLIDDCQKVNFFYGPNGSGKSTIGNFLNNQDDPQYSSCEIKWQNNSALSVILQLHEVQYKQSLGCCWLEGRRVRLGRLYSFHELIDERL